MSELNQEFSKDHISANRVQIGGEKVGGNYQLSLEDGPLVPDFTIKGDIKGDLLTVVHAGKDQNIGLVDLKPGSEDLKDNNRYALVKLSGIDLGSDDVSNLEPIAGEEQKLYGAILREPNSDNVLGNNAEKITPGLEIFTDKDDQFYSGVHFGIKINPDISNIEITDLNSKNGTTILSKKTENTESLDSTYRLDDLTVDETTRPKNEVLENVPEEVAEDLGETALSDVAVEAVTEEANVDKQKELISEKAMTELRETWGLNPEISEQDAVRMLEDEAAKIETVVSWLRDFEPSKLLVMKDLLNVLNIRDARLNSRNLRSVEDFINDRKRSSLMELRDTKKTIFSKDIRTKLDSAIRNIDHIRYKLEDVKTARNYNQLAESAYPLKASLNSLGGVDHDMNLAITRIDEMLTRIRGYGYEGIERNKKDKTEFRNEQVKKWSKELAGDVTPERMEEIIAEMENGIRIESAMVDDPKSPSRWFGNRVMDNTEKQERVPQVIDGKEVAIKKGAQRLTAEMMAKILSGKFDIKLSNDKVIEITNDRITGGQGRAAALAMIYGENWQKKAKELGLEIVKK